METAKVVTAKSLKAAWDKYVGLFGVVPHGTEKQLAAMLELVPEDESNAGSWEEYQHIKKNSETFANRRSRDRDAS
jgi:hypothetical protein